MMMTTTTIMITMATLKKAFLNLLQSAHLATNCLQTTHPHGKLITLRNFI